MYEELKLALRSHTLGHHPINFDGERAITAIETLEAQLAAAKVMIAEFEREQCAACRAHALNKQKSPKPIKA